MKFNWQRGLPFIPIELCVDGKRLAYEHALIDTGAGSSLFNINLLFENHLELKESDTLCEMVGIGGTEQVFQRTVEYAYFAGCTIEAPIVQFGDTDYGFNIDGIIGSDLLKTIAAVIDFECDEIFQK